MTTTAAQIASRPDAYGARVHTLAMATQVMYRCRSYNPNRRHRILHGSDDTFWIMPNRIAQILARAGYEIVA